MNKPAVSFFLLAVTAALLCGGCKTEAPSPWKEMYLPLSNCTILPGANATRIKVKYSNNNQFEAYFREYTSALENAGYSYTGEAPNHDPATHTLAGLFEKDKKRIRLTITYDVHTTADLHFETE